MTSRSDADVFGFRRAVIYDFLESHGLSLNRGAPAAIYEDPETEHSKGAVMPKDVSQQSTNGSGRRSRFTAISAAKRAEFISYREAMTKLAESTGDQLKEIAVALKLHEIHTKNMAWLKGFEKAVTTITSDEFLSALLDWTIRHNEINVAPIDDQEEDADPDTIGWMRNGFVDSIEIDIGLFSPESLRTPDAESHGEPVVEIADWMIPYKGRREVSLGDAAAILAGCGPIPLPSNMRWTAEGKAKIAAWREALVDAIGRDFEADLDFVPEIEASSWTSNRDEEQMLSHAGIRTWCARRGYVWPIPDLLQQANDAPTQEARALRRVIDELRENIADRDASSISFETRSNRAIIERDTQIDVLQQELDAAKAELDAAKFQSAPNAEAVVEIERLKAEVERYKAELTEAKEGAVYADHPQCPRELDECLTVWRYATKRWRPGEQTPKSAVEEAIRELFPTVTGKQFERYSAVCNWDKTPGRKPSK